jgi:hypothetical protein
MTVIIQGTQLRTIGLGTRIQGKTSTFTAGGGTHQLFTVAGGEVFVTGLYGKVTTAVSLAAQKITLVADPTTGTTVNLSEISGDIGTTDTAVGDLITGKMDADGTTNLPIPSVGPGVPFSFVMSTGEIELLVSDETGTEAGVIEWYLTYVPLTDGATVVAAA